MFKVGGHTLDWRDPTGYLILWTLASLVLIALSGFAPATALSLSMLILFGTIIGLMNQRKGK